MKRHSVVPWCLVLLSVFSDAAPSRAQDLSAPVTKAMEALDASDPGLMAHHLAALAEHVGSLMKPARKVKKAYEAGKAERFDEAARLLTDAAALLGPVDLSDPAAAYFAGGLYLFWEHVLEEGDKAYYKNQPPLEPIIDNRKDLEEKIVGPSKEALKDGRYRLVIRLTSIGCNLKVWKDGNVYTDWKFSDSLMDMRFDRIQASLGAGWGPYDLLGRIESYLEYLDSDWGTKDPRRQEFIDRIKPVVRDLAGSMDTYRHLIAGASRLYRAWADLRGNAGDQDGQYRTMDKASRLADEAATFSLRLVSIGEKIGVEVKDDPEIWWYSANTNHEYLWFLRQYLTKFSPEEQAVAAISVFSYASDRAINAIKQVERLDPGRCGAWLLHARLLSMVPVLTETERQAAAAELGTCLKKGEETGQDHPNCLYDAAALYGQYSMGVDMKRALERLVEIAPDDPRVPEAQALIKDLEGKLEGEKE
jgi:hypothetical protein